MDDLDMIYNMNDGKIMAGGYSVNSILLNDQQPALYQREQEGGKGTKKVSDRFKNLAVPAGLLYINDTYKNDTNSINDNNSINDADAIINDALYEKLLHLAGPETKHNDDNTDKHKKQTRSKKDKGNGKNKSKSKKKLTKKHLHRK
jgi:hypothetical protein